MWKSLIVGMLALCVGTVAQASTATWAAGNGHSYEVVLFGSGPNLSWDQARDAAAVRKLNGVAGHLATVTSQDEWTFIINALNSAKHDLFLGASDAAREGEWVWSVGPEAGQLLDDTFAAWNANEPNDYGAGEDYLAGWSWGQNTGWNDMPAQHSSIKGYLVEYSIAAVPLPAALPLALCGLGLLGGLRQLRRV